MTQKTDSKKPHNSLSGIKNFFLRSGGRITKLVLLTLFIGTIGFLTINNYKKHEFYQVTLDKLASLCIIVFLSYSISQSRVRSREIYKYINNVIGSIDINIDRISEILRTDTEFDNFIYLNSKRNIDSRLILLINDKHCSIIFEELKYLKKRSEELSNNLDQIYTNNLKCKQFRDKSAIYAGFITSDSTIQEQSICNESTISEIEELRRKSQNQVELMHSKIDAIGIKLLKLL